MKKWWIILLAVLQLILWLLLIAAVVAILTAEDPEEDPLSTTTTTTTTTTTAAPTTTRRWRRRPYKSVTAGKKTKLDSKFVPLVLAVILYIVTFVVCHKIVGMEGGIQKVQCRLSQDRWDGRRYPEG